MTLTLRLFCFLIALFLFALAAVGWPPSGRFNVVAAGLFFATAGVAFG